MAPRLCTFLIATLLAGILGLATATDPEPECENPPRSGFWDALGAEPLPFNCPPEETPPAPATPPADPGATFEDFNSPPELAQTPSYHTLLVRPISGELTTLLVDVATDSAIGVFRESGSDEVAGSVFFGPDRNPFLVVLGDAGLPRYATYLDLLFVYGNYGTSTVDVAVIRNDQVLYVTEAGIDPASLELLRSGTVAGSPARVPRAASGANEYYASSIDITDFDLDVIALQVASGAITVAACYFGGPLAVAACAELAFVALGGYAELAVETGLIEELPSAGGYNIWGWVGSTIGVAGGAVEGAATARSVGGAVVGGIGGAVPSLVSVSLSTWADHRQQTRIRSENFDLVLRGTAEALSYSRGELAFILASDRSNTLDMIVLDPDNNAISILRPATARGSNAEVLISPNFTKTVVWRDGQVKPGSYHLFLENRGNQTREAVVTQRLGGQGFVFAEEIAPGERILLRSFDLIP